MSTKIERRPSSVNSCLGPDDHVPATTLQIEILCETFLRSWETRSGISGINRFLSDHAEVNDSDRRLLLSLIQIDLEGFWSKWARFAEKQLREPKPIETLQDHWKAMPRFQHYAALFDSPEEAARYWRDMANFESYCRDRWGDAVGPSYYKHYFSVATDDYHRRTRRHLRCEFESNEDFSQMLFPLRGTSEVGRQRSKDQDAYFCEINPDGNRIVVAGRQEAEVSREQLSVQLLTPEVTILTNRSGVNSIRVAPDMLLAPGERTLSTFPFTVQVPGRRLCGY